MTGKAQFRFSFGPWNIYEGELKPNKPLDHAYCPTTGHFMALGAAKDVPSRVGILVESAHAVLAGLAHSKDIFLMLVEVVKRLDMKKIEAYRAFRNYEELEYYMVSSMLNR